MNYLTIDPYTPVSPEDVCNMLCALQRATQDWYKTGDEVYKKCAKERQTIETIYSWKKHPLTSPLTITKCGKKEEVLQQRYAIFYISEALLNAETRELQANLSDEDEAFGRRLIHSLIFRASSSEAERDMALKDFPQLAFLDSDDSCISALVRSYMDYQRDTRLLNKQRHQNNTTDTHDSQTPWQICQENMQRILNRHSNCII